MSMTLAYLLSIGRDFCPLGRKLDLTRGTLGEDESPLVSATGKRQIELSNIRVCLHIEFVRLLSILEQCVNKMVAIGSRQSLPS